MEINNFTPGLLRKSPSALKRCLRSQKKLKLSMKCSEWTVQAVESHVFSANNLLNLSTPFLTGGRGPLITTSAFSELTVLNRSPKSRFSTSDCCFTTSFAPMCSMMCFTFGCAATICRTLSVMSETQSLGKQSTLVFLLHMLLTSFMAQSPRISVSGPVVSFPCCLLLSDLLSDLLSFLTLLFEEEWLFRSSDGDPGSCSSGANLLSSRTLGCWGGLLFFLPFTAVHGCVLLGTGVEEAVCLGNADHPVTSGCWALPVTRYLLLLPVLPFSQEMN